MNLTAENTAIVLDSTADLPDAADRFPNWRVVPLYVSFGGESLRDGVDIDATEFYERLRASSVFPTTSQPTPGDFLAVFEELSKNLVRNAHLTPAGIVAVGRAQERGFTFGYGG